jgi:hypothetical protein
VRWRGIVVGLISELIFVPEAEDDALCLLAFAEQVLRKERVSAMVTEGFPARVRRVFSKHGFIEHTPAKENVRISIGSAPARSRCSKTSRTGS